MGATSPAKKLHEAGLANRPGAVGKQEKARMSSDTTHSDSLHQGNTNDQRETEPLRHHHT